MAVSGLTPEIQAEIARLESRRAQLLSQREQIANSVGGAAGVIGQTQKEILALNQEIASLVITIERLQYGEGGKNTTAPAEVKDSNNSATQSPPVTTADGSYDSLENRRLTTQQAQALAGQTETGTDPQPAKTLAQTQSVSNADPGVITEEYYPPGTGANTADPSPIGPPGVGANDNNPGADGQSRATTQRILNAVKNSYFKPRPNVLDQYASYTYSLSWYMMGPTEYNDLVEAGKINYSSFSLLAQSGGAPESPAAGQGGRNAYFRLDYYIDNLSLTTAIVGKGTNRAHNSVELQFTVTETAGVTLLENLYKAGTSVYKRENLNTGLMWYCMVIKFYGYDDSGKLVQVNADGTSGTVVEKIIPFKIRNITFRVANKVVEYKVDAAAIPYDIGFGSNLGVIKGQTTITGATVGNLLTSGIAGAEVISPNDGRQTTSTPLNANDGSFDRLERQRLGIDDGSYQTLENRRLGI